MGGAFRNGSAEWTILDAKMMLHDSDAILAADGQMQQFLRGHRNRGHVDTGTRYALIGQARVL